VAYFFWATLYKSGRGEAVENMSLETTARKLVATVLRWRCGHRSFQRFPPYVTCTLYLQIKLHWWLNCPLSSTQQQQQQAWRHWWGGGCSVRGGHCMQCWVIRIVMRKPVQAIAGHRHTHTHLLCNRMLRMQPLQNDPLPRQYFSRSLIIRYSVNPVQDYATTTSTFIRLNAYIMSSTRQRYHASRISSHTQDCLTPTAVCRLNSPPYIFVESTGMLARNYFGLRYV